MKSVIAQGSTIPKAIEEALKKAGMPAEFFIKLLEDAQGGFLGFGAKKAKIALFFKQNQHNAKNNILLNQETYQDLFENNAISRQIEQQLKDVGSTTNQPQKQQPKRPMQQQPQRPVQQQHSKKPIQHRSQPVKQQHAPKPTQTKNNIPQPMQQQPQQQIQPKQNSNSTKLMVRPLPNKKNDSSKS